MFVEDEGRGVADTVYISTVEINSLIRCIQEQVPDSKNELNKILVCLGQKLRFPAENALESICKALALGLVSFTVSHVNRFDVETFRKEIGTFNVGSGATFALRELACLGDFVCGPFWVLGRNTSTAKLKISMDVDDFSFLWGPNWLVDSMIRTERGFVVAVEPSDPCKKEEIECYFGTEIPRCHIRKTLSATSRILIGSNHHIYTVNRDCPTTVESVEDRVASELQLLGTSASGYDSDGYTLGANAGKNATATQQELEKEARPNPEGCTVEPIQT